jgi:hypothetical protein
MPPIASKIGSIIKNLLGAAGGTLQRWRSLIIMGVVIVGILLAAIVTIPQIIQKAIDYSANLSSDSSRKVDDTFSSKPQEEFFLPDEPDFLPEVLLEQEPRPWWTAEDVRPFWRDPMDEDPEMWRKRIEMAIDELLKGVP